ncbi:MAG: hypothetical protein SFY69_02255 [Planctomycetota bacterium]|nr:hypothetical protein [Planctomycetota bacterium]
MPRRACAAALVVPVLALSALVGCSSKGTSPSAIRSDLTPELRTSYQRPEDIRNMYAHTTNANYRLMRDDFYRFWLLERPSRLSLTPMPH